MTSLQTNQYSETLLGSRLSLLGLTMNHIANASNQTFIVRFYNS